VTSHTLNIYSWSSVGKLFIKSHQKQQISIQKPSKATIYLQNQ